MSSFDTRSTPPNTSESSENVKPHRFRKRKTLPLKDHCKARTIFTNKRKVLPTPPSYDRDQDQSISIQSQETTTKRVRFSPDVTFIDAAAPSQNTRPSDPPPAHRLQGLSIPASEPPFPNPVSPQQHRDRPTAAPPTDTHSQTRRRRIYQTSSLVVLPDLSEPEPPSVGVRHHDVPVLHSTGVTQNYGAPPQNFQTAPPPPVRI